MGVTAEGSEWEREWPDPYRLSYEVIVMATSLEHAQQLGESLKDVQPPWVKGMSFIRAEKA